MPRLQVMQTTFNSGILAPLLHSRRDIKHYYNGMEEGNNIVTLPQGGVKRRDGLKYLATLPTGTVRLCPFAFSVDTKYLIVFSDQLATIYSDGVAVDTVVLPYTEAQLPDLRWTQSADTVILCHSSHQPRLLQRFAHDDWRLAYMPIRNMPGHAFGGDDIDNITFTVQEYNINTGAPTVTVTTGADELLSFAVSGGTLSDIDATDYAVHGQMVRITASSAIFESRHEGGIWYGQVGSARILDVQSSTVADAEVIVEINMAKHRGYNCVLTEPAWSSTRSWPRTAVFHEGRLWFGGSDDLPLSLWGSVSNDYFNFDTGEGLDDEALFVTLDTDQINEIQSLSTGRVLQVFTSGAEFAILSDPITPADIIVKRQTKFGSSDIEPVNIDGATLYIDKTGKALREFLYTENEGAYVSTSVSILAPHLINSPVAMAALPGTQADDTNYVYLVNTDGTAAVFNTLRSQEVAGWTTWDTEGSFKDVCVVVDDVYFLVERTINGSTVNYLEILDPDTYTDSAKHFTAVTGSVTGLSHIEGEVCRVRSDDLVRDDVTIASGAATVDAADAVEIGLNFSVNLKTMPVGSDFQDGPIYARKKRIIKAYIDQLESVGMIVNGFEIPARTLDVDTFDSGVDPQTGLYGLPMLGWSRKAQVTIEQNDPAPMTLRALILQVEV